MENQATKAKGRVAKPAAEKPKAQIQKENIPIKNNKEGFNTPVPVVNVASATVAAPIAKEQNDVKEVPQDTSVSAKEMLDAQYPTPTNNNFDVNDYPIAGPGKPASEEVVVPKTPAEDPSFKALTSSINANAKKQRKHEPAQSASKKAQKAAAVPSNERLSKAQASQVEVMEQQETGEFKASDFKEQLKSRIAEMELPKDEEAADKFKENNNLSEVKSAAMGDVKTAQDNAAGGIPEATSAAPNTASVPVTAVSPMPKAIPGKKPAMIPTAQAMPSKRSEASVEKPLQEETASLDTQMEQHGVTDAMLANSNEASFKSALDEKNNAKAQSKASVASFRNTENQELNTAQQQSQQQVNATSQGMHTNRVAAFNKVAGNQKQSATQNTAARKQVADKIQGLYTETKTKVTSILSALDTAVASKFESGARAAQQAFENHIETNMKAYKEKRYGSSIFSWKQLRRVKDAFVGLPKEVNQFFESGRKIYIDTMDSYLGSIATLVANELNKAKRTIKEGKKSVQDYVGGLSPDLRKIGQQAANEIQSKFDSLEQDIDNKKDTLIDVLSQKYSEAVASVDTQIEALKEKNSGLINKAMGALKGVFDIIIKVKNTLTNLLANVVTAVGAIISDPIGFFKMLITGVGQGVQNFMTNIVQHLQSGLLGWLTGAMGSLSIQMPENIFSLKGIFSLTTQILGFTWSTIRTVGVKVVGEPIVKALETGFEMVQILREKGIAGLWEHLKEQFQDLKETVIGAIKDMLMSQVVQAGIKWILGLLSPVGAFVKAIMAIIDVVKFFIQRASQIAELVSAFTESIAAIAAGKVGAVAKSIENALGKAVPVVIGLLASVLGIGGLANKVLGIVRKIRKRVEKALFSLWTKIKSAGRKVWKKLGFGKKKEEKEGDLSKKEQFLNLVEKKKIKKEFETVDQHTHTLFLRRKGNSVELMVASNPQTYKEFIGDVDLDDPQKKTHKTTAIGIAKKVDAKINERLKGDTKEEKKASKKKKDAEFEALLLELSKPTGILFGVDREDLPETEVQHRSSTIGGAKMATKMYAKRLTQKGIKGGKPNDDRHKVMDALLVRADGNGSYYVRGHLLNMELHGPGTWENLTPLSQTGNKNHLREAEKAIKIAVNSGAIVDYTLIVKYGRSIQPFEDTKLEQAGFVKKEDKDKMNKLRVAEASVPNHLVLRSYLLKKEGNDFVRDKLLVEQTNVQNPVETNIESYKVDREKREKVSLSSSTPEVIAKNTILDLDEAIIVNKAAKAISSLRTYEQIIDFLPQIESDLIKLEDLVEKINDENIKGYLRKPGNNVTL
ncbi:phage tail protein [Tenacibaculum sp. M341]|uniref:phage tail protein n=1 Tax=Tenacibaculum sp. M341 TaxID=2530339 RepID=UPI001043FDCE|nr:hypothetical protein [Tenacibaculum sp. M341]TCI93193.1 hypothetical protein EYW44_06140 [Tenacibaculum sp. M341]